MMVRATRHHLTLPSHQATSLLRRGHFPHLISLVPVISLLAIVNKTHMRQNIPLQPPSNPTLSFAQAVMLI
jgi:hypothetical protein